MKRTSENIPPPSVFDWGKHDEESLLESIEMAISLLNKPTSWPNFFELNSRYNASRSFEAKDAQAVRQVGYDMVV